MQRMERASVLISRQGILPSVLKGAESIWVQTALPSLAELEWVVLSSVVHPVALLLVGRQDWLCLSSVVPYLTSEGVASSEHLCFQEPFCSMLNSGNEV